MCESNKCATKRRQRFKGIENFLRRISFNLGNSPSQTEVKIISCIPIDVTDLQQKIIMLEKQLSDACRPDCTRQRCPLAHQMAPQTPQGHIAMHVQGTPTPTTNQTQGNMMFNLNCNPNPIMIPNNVLPIPSSRQINGEPCGYHDSNATCPCGSNRTTVSSLYKSPDRKKRRKKEMQQLLYYAETKGSPFQQYRRTEPRAKAYYKECFPELMSKQTPQTWKHQQSESSHFTSPVCRDYDPKSACTFFQSDICSCCHGTFINIDSQLNKNHDDSSKYVTNKGAYYNSSLYDIVPVREKPDKANIEEIHKKKKSRGMDEKYWHKEMPGKPRNPPIIVNHAMTTHRERCRQRFPAHEKKEQVHNKMESKRQKGRIVDSIPGTGTSKSCYIDFGDVYLKTLYSKMKMPMTVLQKNAECLTVNPVHTECQVSLSKDSKLERNKSDVSKGEIILSQIKSILQSVLTEVKAIPQLKHLDEPRKKDAIVQKGSCPGNIEAHSTLLNSFTYSPYNMSPYMASCSQRLTPNSMWSQSYYDRRIGGPHLKCLQNFPVLMPQQVPPPLYESCARMPTKTPSPGPPRHVATTIATAATTATNTDTVPDNQQPPTESLVKGISKSRVNKEFTASNATNKVAIEKDPKKKLPATSFEVESLLSNRYTTIAESADTGVTPQSRDKTHSNDRHYDEKKEKYSDSFMQKIIDGYIEKHSHLIDENTSSPGSSEESSSEELSQAHYKDKPGVFKKVVNTLKRFTRQRRVRLREESEDEETWRPPAMSDYESSEASRGVQRGWERARVRHHERDWERHIVRSQERCGERDGERRGKRDLQRLTPYWHSYETRNVHYAPELSRDNHNLSVPPRCPAMTPPPPAQSLFPARPAAPPAKAIAPSETPRNQRKDQEINVIPASKGMQFLMKAKGSDVPKT